MSLDPRTPVIVGVGQHNQRVDRGEPALEPADMMVVAAQTAMADAGITDASAVESVRTVGSISWRYRDVGALVAERLGVGHDVDSAVTIWAGSSPQMLVNATARDIQAGDVDCVLLTGAESWRTRMDSRRNDTTLDWTVQSDDVTPARQIGEDMVMNHEAESALGLFMPIKFYPLFEQAHRHRLGRTMDEHLPEIAALWSRFSEVAAGNPHAWIQEAMTPEEIATASPSNRQVSLPYTKVMNSNEMVEQSAAVLVCSVAKAEALGISRDRWVFPLSGADAHEHNFVSHRDTLDTAPAVGVAGRAAMDAAGVTVDDIDHVDLYSCFPIAVQVGADQLGFSLDRQLTLTGGLRFAGGPWNNYVMHAIATMVETLRADPGSRGFVWGNGGLLTKHAFGVYSTDAPADGFQYRDPQAEIDALPSREVSLDHAGPAEVETWTVMFDKDSQPEEAIFVLRLADGRRAWGVSHDPGVVAHAATNEMIGTTVHRSAEGAITL